MKTMNVTDCTEQVEMDEKLLEIMFVTATINEE